MRVRKNLEVALDPPQDNGSAARSAVDECDTWSSVSTLDFRAWRTEVVPMGPYGLAFGHNEGFVSPDTNTPLARSFVCFQNVDPLAPNGDYCQYAANPQDPAGWNNFVPLPEIAANAYGQTIITRTPGAVPVLLAYPDTLENDMGDGYRMYGMNGTFPMPPIVPMSKPDGFVLHVTAIDLGVGPILFYWYDIDRAAKSAIIRGRFVVQQNVITADFSISEPFSIAMQCLPANMPCPYWFGDYHTAGGFEIPESTILDQRGTIPVYTTTGPSYEYYPVWVQPGGQVHFAKVRYELPDSQIPALHIDLQPQEEIELELRLPNNFVNGVLRP